MISGGGSHCLVSALLLGRRFRIIAYPFERFPAERLLCLILFLLQLRTKQFLQRNFAALKLSDKKILLQFIVCILRQR